MFYDNILKEISERVFIPKSFYSVNKNLRNFKLYQMNAPVVDASMGDIFGLDTEAHAFNLILDDFNQNINKVVIRSLFDTNKFEWVDLRNTSSSTHEYCNKMIDFIMIHGKGFKNIITNSRIATCLQDSSYFHVSAYNSNVRTSGSDVYEIGCICGVKVWIDPYLRYDDDRMIIFNEVFINIEGVKGVIVDEATFRPRIRLDHKMDFILGDSKIIYVIETESSPGWLKVKQLNRDLKINQILNEEE